MKLLTPSLLLAASLTAAPVAAQPLAEPQRDGASRGGPDAHELDHARRELHRAREELRRAAQEFARAAAALGRQSPMAKAFEFVMDPDHAVLGVIVDADREGPDAGRGVRVHAVTPGSGADKAGLRAGDLILAVNGRALAVPPGQDFRPVLHEVMAQTRVGDAVEVDYERNGQRGQVRVVAGRAHPPDIAYAHPLPEADIVMPPRPLLHAAHLPHPAPPLPPQVAEHDTADLQLCALNKELGEYFRTSEGVLVVRAPDSGALELRGGDVIQKVDGTPVKDPITVMARLFESEPGNVELQVLRRGRSLTLRGPVPLSPTVLGELDPDTPPRLPYGPRP